MTNLRLSLAASLVFLLGGSVCWAQQEIPLGDLVRKQKTGPKAERVITNDEIPERGDPEPEPAAAAAAAAATAAPAADAAQAAEDAQPQEESEAEKEARTRIEALKADEAAYEKNIDKVREQMNQEGISDFRRRMYEDVMVSAEQNLEQAQRERQELEEKQKAEREKSRAGGAMPRP